MLTFIAQQYICRQCGHTLSSTPPAHTSRMICPNCKCNFLDLLQNPTNAENSRDIGVPANNEAHLLPQPVRDGESDTESTHFADELIQSLESQHNYMRILPRDNFADPEFDEMIDQFFGTPPAVDTMKDLPKDNVEFENRRAGTDGSSGGGLGGTLETAEDLPKDNVEFENTRAGADMSGGGMGENLESSTIEVMAEEESSNSGRIDDTSESDDDV